MVENLNDNKINAGQAQSKSSRPYSGYVRRHTLIHSLFINPLLGITACSGKSPAKYFRRSSKVLTTRTKSTQTKFAASSSIWETRRWKFHYGSKITKLFPKQRTLIFIIHIQGRMISTIQTQSKVHGTR